MKTEINSALQELDSIVGLSDELPETSAKKEPGLDDLSDLDKLLEDSLKLAKKSPNRRIYKETRDAVKNLEREIATVQWEILEYISVWYQVQCSCGEKGLIVFCRHMCKKRLEKKRITHWENVEAIPKDAVAKNVVIYREVSGCENCIQFDHNELELFNEVIA